MKTTTTRIGEPSMTVNFSATVEPEAPITFDDRGHPAEVSSTRVSWSFVTDSDGSGRWYSRAKTVAHWRKKDGTLSDVPRHVFTIEVAEFQKAAIEATRPTWEPTLTKTETEA